MKCGLYIISKELLGVSPYFLAGSFTQAINSSADYMALNKQYFPASYTTSYSQRRKHLRPVVD